MLYPDSNSSLQEGPNPVSCPALAFNLKPNLPEWLSQLSAQLFILAEFWCQGHEFKPQIGLHVGVEPTLRKKTEKENIKNHIYTVR